MTEAMHKVLMLCVAGAIFCILPGSLVAFAIFGKTGIEFMLGMAICLLCGAATCLLGIAIATVWK